MKHVLVELEKLRTVRGTWVLLAAGVLGPLPLAVLILILGSEPARAPQDVLSLVGITLTLCAALAAVACAREFEHRTIATAFTLEPRRERVIAAKAAAIAIVGAAAAILFAALALSLTAVWLSAAGDPWPWTAGETFRGIVGAVVLVPVVSVAGTGCGGLTRHVGAAITILFAFYGVAEAILVDRLAFWHDHGVTAAMTVLLEPARAHVLGFPAALAVLVLASLAFLAAGIAVVRRTDV